MYNLSYYLKPSWIHSYVHTNKRPMSHIAHLRNRFKSIHMITCISYHLIKEENTHSFVRIEWLLFFIWPNLNPLHPRMLCLVEIGPAVLEKKIFKIRQRIFLFRSYLPLEKGVALQLNKPDALFCAKFGWNWPGGSREEDF